MFAVTLDQIASSTSKDQVPSLLEAFVRLIGEDDVELGFERTAGDEVQGLVATVSGLRHVLSHALRDGHWRIGVGIGDVDQPLPASTRAASGPAYVLARRAVERAKGRRAVARLAVEGQDADAASELEAAWHLVAVLGDQRTPKMWEAIDTVVAMGSNHAGAKALGISAQALSERLRRSGWAAEVKAHALLDALAERAE